MSKLNAAIFYDLENLFGGYSTKENIIKYIDFDKLFKTVEGNNNYNVIIKKAYANWSDSRLMRLQRPVIEYGIEAIQMFGFGKGNAKNNSDIALAIDVVDIINNKDLNIDVIIVVSGDGGFSALANKVKNKGKIYIGVGRIKSSNYILKRLSNQFITLDENIFSNNTKTLIIKEGDKPVANNDSTHPVILGYMKIFPVDKQINEGINFDTILNVSLSIIDYLLEVPSAKKYLPTKGLNIGTLKKMIEYRIPHAFKFLNNIDIKYLEFLGHLVVESGKIKMLRRIGQTSYLIAPIDLMIMDHEEIEIEVEDE